MAGKHTKSGWLVACFALASCAVPFTRVELPLEPLNGICTIGYQCGEDDRHNVRLYIPGHDPKQGPHLVEHWREKAFPFGELRHAKTMTGPYAFTSDVWFYAGIPKKKGDTCGFQTYHGIKIEGGIYKEMKGDKRKEIPLEFHEIEQNAARHKCDLDVEWGEYNIAGY